MKRISSVIFICILVAISIVAYKKREKLSLFCSIHSSKPAWVEHQIKKDFVDFKSHGISKEALDTTFAQIESHQLLVYRYRVIDGQIYRIGKKDDRSTIFEKILRRIGYSARLPNVDFLICMMDGVPEVYVPSDFYLVNDPKLQAPLLAWAKKEWAPKIVLIPDVFTTLRDSWKSRVKEIEKNFQEIPWEKRIERAFWRGTASDKIYTLENYKYKPRFLLSKASLTHPTKVDAGFINTNSEDFTKLFQEMGLYKSYASVTEHLAYKYLPVLDGWMCTYPGFQWRLYSGSLTLKQESDEVQYFYSALKPYVHYVPIKNDMSDLIEKINWAMNNDAKCKQIMQNGRAFVEKNLMLDSIYSYFYWVLKNYESLQTFDVRKLKEETEQNPKWIRVYRS